MGRRLFVLGMLLWAPAVWAQCQPTNNPTTDLSNSTSVTPDQVPFAAVNVNVSAADGSLASHRLTNGDGTNLVVNFHAWNAASLELDYQWQGGNRVKWFTPSSLVGSVSINTKGWSSGAVLTVFAVATEKPGSGSFTPSTQDRIVITTNTQVPGIYSYDNLPSDNYAMINLNYNGTPNIPYQTTCPNAAEKDMLPTAQLNLSNTTSGENRNGVSFQGATTVVGQPVSATAYDYISFVPATTNNGVSFPGDVITVGAGGFVYCSAIGDFWQGFKDFQGTAELAVTFSQVTGFVGQNASLRQWCLLADIPPDYNPNILLNAQPGATYAWGTALLYNTTWNSGTWLVFGPGLAYSLTGTYTRKPCTHNPPPY